MMHKCKVKRATKQFGTEVRVLHISACLTLNLQYLRLSHTRPANVHVQE